MFENILPFKGQTAVTVIHAIHPKLGAVAIFDSGEYVEFGKPAIQYPHGPSLIGAKSRKPRVLFDFSVAPLLSEQGVDITGGLAYGHHVADWCNRLIDQARLGL